MELKSHESIRPRSRTSGESLTEMERESHEESKRSRSCSVGLEIVQSEVEVSHSGALQRVVLTSCDSTEGEGGVKRVIRSLVRNERSAALRRESLV